MSSILQIAGVTETGSVVPILVDAQGRIKTVPASKSVHNAVTADALLAVAAGPGLRLVGFSARESASIAAVATFRLIHGATVQEQEVLIPVELGLDESTSDWFNDGIECLDGISIDWIAGEFDLVIYYRRS